MSWDVISACAKAKVGSAMRKALLVYMADKASDDGSGIWASKNNIALDMETTRRTIQREILQLIELGVLSEVGKRECANGYTVEYQINLHAVKSLPSTRDTLSPVSPRHGEGRHTVSGTRDTLSPEPPIEPPIEPTSLREDAFGGSGGKIKDIWKDGLEALIAMGVSKTKAKGLIGKWVKSNGKEKIGEAISAALGADTGDPVAYITAILSPKNPLTTEEMLKARENRPRMERPKWN